MGGIASPNMEPGAALCVAPWLRVPLKGTAEEQTKGRKQEVTSLAFSSFTAPLRSTGIPCTKEYFTDFCFQPHVCSAGT